ncbi:Uncharacterised protein [Suttonella indologenes]|uniref:Uncharacterized protein n=1 Tax=Suttonella indologenes TaxID=13276 RepID=A0A380MYV7_9GAMM|nr:Uncharacterised protein [Suttonella indologenes]
MNGDALFSSPVIFSEWSFMGEMVCRTEYVYQKLVEDKHYRTNYATHKKYLPTHFLKLSEQG